MKQEATANARCPRLVWSRAAVQDNDRSVWLSLRREARKSITRGAELATLMTASILIWPSLTTAICHRITIRLNLRTVSGGIVANAFHDACRSDQGFAKAMACDFERIASEASAPDGLVALLLYHDGYHARQTHRLCHWLWLRGQIDLAMLIQCRASEVFREDICPAEPVDERAVPGSSRNLAEELRAGAAFEALNRGSPLTLVAGA